MCYSPSDDYFPYIIMQLDGFVYSIAGTAKEVQEGELVVYVNKIPDPSEEPIVGVGLCKEILDDKNIIVELEGIKVKVAKDMVRRMTFTIPTKTDSLDPIDLAPFQ